LPPIGEEDPEDIPRAADLFNPATTARVVLMQNLVPAVATAGAYLAFRLLPIAGV
jgi:PiT family inorganic phosphate transporter